MGSFGASGDNPTQASGQLFLEGAPAAGDVPVFNADGTVTPTPAADLVIGGVVITGPAAAGDILVATGTDTAAWTAPLAAVGKAFTAKGDVIVGTGAGTAAILPLGTSTEQLTVGGAGATGVEWASA